MAKISPLGDRIVVHPRTREEPTRGGIVLPDTAKEKPQEGIVVAVGPGSRSETGRLIPINIKEGDTVLYAKYAGTEVRLDDNDYLILSERDILALISEGPIAASETAGDSTIKGKPPPPP